MAQERDIKYINREFSDFRNQLIEFAKNYFPDTYNDFSPSAPGTMFIEMAAYVGDVLSFYQDTQLQETFLQHAKDPANLYSLAYMMGYRPKVTAASEVSLELTQRIDANTANGYKPKFNQAFTVLANSTFQAGLGNGTKFILDKQVDFRHSSSFDPTEITVYSVDGSNNPSEYLLKKSGRAISGEIITVYETVGSQEKFKTITIDDSNIIGILDIVDDSGNGDIWYEVPFLGQDTVFTESGTASSNTVDVPVTLSLTKVPKRFVTRFNSSNQLQIQFGSGIASQDDSIITPNPSNVGLGTANGVSKIDYAYDPSNFLFTKTYGLAPSNTTLKIRYLKGGGVSANEEAGTITSKVNILTTPASPVKIDTLQVTNPQPASGGRDGDTVEELRQNALRSFNEQSRVVTLQDYTVRAVSMPTRFGSVAKAYATQDPFYTSTNNTDILIDNNPLAVSLYILSYDSAGKLINSSTNLKNNLKKYLSQYIILTDSVNIKDAYIINIGIKYDLIPLPGTIGRDVLLRCNSVLRDYFKTENWSINQPINLAPVYTLLDRVKGVQSIQNIIIENKVGGNYSELAYDIKGATRNNIIYPSLDPSIFEVKFPETDIEGRITTI